MILCESDAGLIFLQIGWASGGKEADGKRTQGDLRGDRRVRSWRVSNAKGRSYQHMPQASGAEIFSG